MADPIVARRGLVATYLHRAEHRPRRRGLHHLPVPLRAAEPPLRAIDLVQIWLVRAAVLVAAVALLGLAAQLDAADAAAAMAVAGVLHPAWHPFAGQTVKLQPAAPNPDVQAGGLFRVEDWWDRVYGGSWKWAEGNPAAMKYAFRSAIAGLPMDDEVVYGKDEHGLGHLVHVSELVEPSTEEKA